jgi:DNA-binding winged helix-turn-helix (wHTH) protein
MLKPPSGTSWEFEGFEVLTAKRLLLGGGTPVPLTSKAFDTLVVLIENRDRVVTKDQLLRAVWPDVEVEEGNLTQQIFLLRKALGENAQQPRYIVTVPGHGYRFTAPLKTLSADAATTAIARRIGAVDGRLGSTDEAIPTMARERSAFLGRADLAHRVPGRSSRTSDV